MSAIALDYNFKKILSKAYNTPFFGHPGRWTIHAEERLLNKYRGHIPILLICRIKQNGLGKSKPCRKCRGLLRRSRVDSILYYDDTSWILERL